MKHKMFVIYDEKAQAYLQPWFLHQSGMATRVFSDCINDPEHNFGRHPEDYTLFNIGEFDDSNANINLHPPKSMGNGIEFKKQTTEEDQLDFIEQQQAQELLQKSDGEDT